MRLHIRPLAAGLLVAGCLWGAPCLFAADEGAGWIAMFDGKTLDGWKAGDNPGSWSAKDGKIVGDGERSHLFYMQHECGNCEFKAEVKINHGGNSGMYFRAKFGPEFPAGYEAQVNNTHADWRRTGSLYRFADIKERGEFRVSEALSVERDEPSLKDLHRLIFSFNRKVNVLAI